MSGTVHGAGGAVRRVDYRCVIGGLIIQAERRNNAGLVMTDDEGKYPLELHLGVLDETHRISGLCCDGQQKKMVKQQRVRIL